MIFDYHARVRCDPLIGQWHYFMKIQTGNIDENQGCETHTGETVSHFAIELKELNVPTCVMNNPTNLDIKTNVGGAIVDDIYTVTADGTDKKYIKISIARDDTTKALEIFAFEKTTDEYGNLPAGKTLEKDLKEFSVIAAGTVLVLEQNWI